MLIYIFVCTFNISISVLFTFWVYFSVFLVLFCLHLWLKFEYNLIHNLVNDNLTFWLLDVLKIFGFWHFVLVCAWTRHNYDKYPVKKVVFDIFLLHPVMRGKCIELLILFFQSKLFRFHGTFLKKTKFKKTLNFRAKILSLRL